MITKLRMFDNSIEIFGENLLELKNRIKGPSSSHETSVSRMLTQRSLTMLSLMKAMRSFLVGKHGFSFSSSWILDIWNSSKWWIKRYWNYRRQSSNNSNEQTNRQTWRVNLRSLRNESHRFVSNHRSTTHFRKVSTGFHRAFSRRNRNRINLGTILLNDLRVEVIDRSSRFNLNELNQRFV